MSSGKALVSSERAIPRRPLRVPRAILSLRDVLATRRTGCRCLPVGSFPRRNESRGDSLQKPACQPPFFFLSQQRYGNRGELEACQSSSPLIPPVQTNHRGFALSFPRLLSLLGLAGVSLLSLKLPFSNHPGTSSRLGYLWNAEGYFCLRLVEQTRGGGLARWHRSPRRHSLRQPGGRLLPRLGQGNVVSGHHTRRPSFLNDTLLQGARGQAPSLALSPWLPLRKPRKRWGGGLCPRYSRISNGNSPKPLLPIRGRVSPA